MKLVIINRGVPGSGKSSFISKMKELAIGKSIEVHSTDDLCMVDGKYCFDFKLAGERHRKNLKNFTESLKEGIEIVFCDNTNIKARDYNKYVSAAKQYDYNYVAIVFYPDSIEKHLERNTHGLPEETLINMKDNLLKHFETGDFEQEFVIQPHQGGKHSVRKHHIITRLLEDYK